MTTLFIAGIDTDVGKSVACGVLAKELIKQGYQVFTQKWVETGCQQDNSADLATHQKIVGHNFNTADKQLHIPYRFSFPASPHLAAEMDKKNIDCDFLITQTKALQTQCQHLLIEGAGGLCVPLTTDNLLIDVVKQMDLPIVLVTSGKLGSINHTLLSLNYCHQQNIEVRALIYNQYTKAQDEINNDSQAFLESNYQQHNPTGLFITLKKNGADFSLNKQQLKTLLA